MLSIISKNILKTNPQNFVRFKGVVAPILKNQENNQNYIFGAQQVTYKDREKLVQELFVDLSKVYNIYMKIISFGLFPKWKKVLVDRLNPKSGTKLLDLAGGTGDIAFLFLDALKKNNAENGSHVTVFDINDAMLEKGRKSVKEGGYNQNLIEWVRGDCEKLPFPDNTFNAITISLGIRNVANMESVLKEAHRVLKKDGKFWCMDLSHPPKKIHSILYNHTLYMILARIILGEWKTAWYFLYSWKHFPNQENFKKIIEDCGFDDVKYENLTKGCASIHVGLKK